MSEISAVIRSATDEDLPALSRMASELARQHIRYDPRRFSVFEPLEDTFTKFYREQLRDQNAGVFVADAGGRLAGYVFVRIEPDSLVEWFKATGWVHDVFVGRAWRKTNLGSRLLDAGLAHLQCLGSQGVMLQVAARNASARRFFKKRGFRVTMHEMRLDFDLPADRSDRV